jgi:hypothetical protein
LYVSSCYYLLSILYKYSKCFCIQGHPEFGSNEIKEITLLMIIDFLKKMKNKKSSSDEKISDDSNEDYSDSQYDDMDYEENIKKVPSSGNLRGSQRLGSFNIKNSIEDLKREDFGFTVDMSSKKTSSNYD